jgi:hypothetical protein
VVHLRECRQAVNCTRLKPATARSKTLLASRRTPCLGPPHFPAELSPYCTQSIARSRLSAPLGMAFLPRTLFSASRAAAAKSQFRRSPLPVIVANPFSRLSSTMAPKVPYTHPHSLLIHVGTHWLTPQPAQGPIPVQAGCMLCQWGVGEGQIWQDIRSAR